MAEIKKKNGITPVLLTILLVAAAVVAGFYFTGKYREKNTGCENGDTTEAIDGQGSGQQTGTGSLSALNMTPVNLLFVTNSETGRIEHIVIEILRCAQNKLDYVRIDPEVSYTMTGKLYSSLTHGNTELPQTVTFSELYRYYHSDKAFEAGRQIVSELVNFNIIYYTAVTDVAFEEFFAAGIGGEPADMHFTVSEEDLKSAAYGTEGSVKGALEKALDGAITNWNIGDRLRYLEAYDTLSAADVTFTDAPVIEKNESSSLDTSGTGAILYRILY